MSRFEDRLWSELVCDYGPELARQARIEVPVRTRRTVVSVVAVAAVLCALAVAVLLLSNTHPSSSEAYAVSQAPDGTVTVSINELTGISGANEQLAGLGVRVRVAAVEADCTQTGQIVRVAPAVISELASFNRQGVTIKPELVPREATLVLSARQVGGIVGLSYGLYSDPAPTCIKAGEIHVG